VIIFNEDICKGCGLCVAACPLKIVALSKDKLNAKGFHAAGVIEIKRCTSCASCAIMCPDVAITITK
jgi:2-oxoglutarate ferredoxin oxidoreductase subunit delta